MWLWERLCSMSSDERQALFLTVMLIGLCAAALGAGKEGERRARQEAKLLDAKLRADAEKDRGAK